MILLRYELLMFKYMVLHWCFRINFIFDAWKFICKETKR